MKKDDTYKNEYNNECYINCPEGTSSNNFICVKQTENSVLNCSTEGFFLFHSGLRAGISFVFFLDLDLFSAKISSLPFPVSRLISILSRVR